MAPVVIDYVVGVVYFYYNFGMTLVLALAVTTAGYFAASLYTRQTRMRLRAVVRDREDRSAGIKNDSISQVELVKYSSAEAYEASRYLEAVIFRQRALFERIIYNRTFTFSQGLIVSVGKPACADLDYFTKTSFTFRYGGDDGYRRKRSIVRPQEHWQLCLLQCLHGACHRDDELARVDAGLH